jgi:hypothetical protein
MALRIPKNQIVTGKYTTGEEYVILSSYAPYQGYYYNLNGRTFAGKEFNPKAPEIIRTTSRKFNPLLNNPATATYAKISKIKLDNFIPVTKIYIDDFALGAVDRYFVQKISAAPFLIKEVTKESYEKALSDPLYIAIMINWNKAGTYANIETLDIAEKTMPGIKIYLESEDYIGDDSGYQD